MAITIKNSLVLAFVLSALTAGGVAAQAPAAAPTAQRATATCAGGCCWGVEADFDKVAGVISTTSGYIGGKSANPTYEQVSAGSIGHTEAVQVIYDTGTVS